VSSALEALALLGRVEDGFWILVPGVERRRADVEVAAQHGGAVGGVARRPVSPQALQPGQLAGKVPVFEVLAIGQVDRREVDAGDPRRDQA